MSINFQVFTSSKNTSKDDLCNLRSVKCVKTMATSNEAQVVVWCKYCERYPAQYKCDDCGDKMCQTCKDSHKEYPHFFNHIIVTYPDCETAKKAAEITLPSFTHRDVKNAVFQYVLSVK